MIINKFEVLVDGMGVVEENGFKYWVREYRKWKTVFNETHRICTSCNQPKTYSEMTPDVRGFLNTEPMCLKCNYNRRKAWAEENPDKIKAQHKKWAEENPDKIKAIIDRSRKNGRESARKRSERYRD